MPATSRERRISPNLAKTRMCAPFRSATHRAEVRIVRTLPATAEGVLMHTGNGRDENNPSRKK